MGTAIHLRDYQRHAVQAALDGFRSGQQRLMLVIPTGGGKTVIFGSMVARVRGRSLVLAHRDELVQQAVDKLSLLVPDERIGIVQADRDDADARIVVASVQTLISARRLERIGTFDFIVIDECHHAVAQSYRDILEHLGAFEPGGPKVLGVTATPDRADEVGLSAVFQAVAYETQILDLIAAGYLADIRAKRVGLRADLSEIRSRGGDLVQGQVGEAMIAADAPEHIAEAVWEHARDRRSLVFLPTVEVSQRTAEEMNAAGIRTAHLDGTTPSRERREMLAALRSGELQAVANCLVLTEGFDAPLIDCVVPARPTKSRALFQQMIGRGLRPYPGKRDCLILDPVGATGRHDLISTTNLFGLPVDALSRDQTVTEAVLRVQREAKANDPVFGHLVAVEVDVFNRSSLNWIGSPSGAFILSAGNAIYSLTPDDDAWTLYCIQNGVRQVIVQRVSLEIGQGIAEDRARDTGVLAFVNRTASWRNDPPTMKQLTMIRRLGFSTRSVTNKGIASDLIAALQAERASA